MSNSAEKYGFEKCEMALPRYEDEKHNFLPTSPPPYPSTSGEISYSGHKSQAAIKVKNITDHNESDPNIDKMAKSTFHFTLLLTLLTLLTLVTFAAHWCVHGFRAGGLGFTFNAPETFLELQLVSLQTQLNNRSAEHNGLMSNYLSQVNVSLNRVILDLDASAAEFGMLKCLILTAPHLQNQTEGDGEGEGEVFGGFTGFDEECVKNVELYIYQKLSAASPQTVENYPLLTMLQNLQAMDVEVNSYSAFLDDVVEKAHVLAAELEVLGRPVRIKNETAATPGVDTSRIPVAGVEGSFEGSVQASEDLVTDQKEKIEEVVKNAYERIISPSREDLRSMVSLLATAATKGDVFGDQKSFECKYEIKRTVRGDNKGLDVAIVRLHCAAA